MKEQVDTQKQMGRDFNCGNCRFAVKIRPDPKVLQTQLVCKRVPPPMVAIATPAGVQMMSAPRVVDGRDFCHAYEGPMPVESPIING